MTTTEQPATALRPPTTGESCAQRLRLVLRLNAASSAAAGVLLTAAPDSVDDLLDTGHPGWIRVVGLALLPFAAFVAWLSTGPVDRLRRFTPAIVVADVTWVAASVATVVLGWYSVGGAVAVIAMATVVDLWAVLQWTAWRRLRTR